MPLTDIFFPPVKGTAPHLLDRGSLKSRNFLKQQLLYRFNEASPRGGASATSRGEGEEIQDRRSGLQNFEILFKKERSYV